MCIERKGTLHHQLEQQSVFGMRLDDDIFDGDRAGWGGGAESELGCDASYCGPGSQCS